MSCGVLYVETYNVAFTDNDFPAERVGSVEPSDRSGAIDVHPVVYTCETAAQEM